MGCSQSGSILFCGGTLGLLGVMYTSVPFSGGIRPFLWRCGEEVVIQWRPCFFLHRYLPILFSQTGRGGRITHKNGVVAQTPLNFHYGSVHPRERGTLGYLLMVIRLIFRVSLLVHTFGGRVGRGGRRAWRCASIVGRCPCPCDAPDTLSLRWGFRRESQVLRRPFPSRGFPSRRKGAQGESAAKFEPLPQDHGGTRVFACLVVYFMIGGRV